MRRHSSFLAWVKVMKQVIHWGRVTGVAGMFEFCSSLILAGQERVQ